MQIRKIELTTAVGGDAGQMQIHFRRLIRSVSRKYGYGPIEYCGVQTTEGNGVIHVFVASKVRKTFWIDQGWLSDEWAKIHGAPIVYIKDISSGTHAKQAAQYVAGQYVAGQRGNVRLFQTTRYRKINGASVWRGFRAAAGRHLGKSGIAHWRDYLRGEAVNMADGSIWQRDDIAENGPPSQRIPVGPFPGDGERWRVAG
jgi:hypothetical protein